MTGSLVRHMQSSLRWLCALLWHPAGVITCLCPCHLPSTAFPAQEKGVEHLWDMAEQLAMAHSAPSQDLVRSCRLSSRL